MKFYLSDFGLTDKQIGGTPIFASPEALDGTIFEKTDVYSLGITWFFILMQNVEDFLKFLFWPINDDSQGSPDSQIKPSAKPFMRPWSPGKATLAHYSSILKQFRANRTRSGFKKCIFSRFKNKYYETINCF